jgi:uncharacterized membrane-anchored protein YitT (DUF2179 family)
MYIVLLNILKKVIKGSSLSQASLSLYAKAKRAKNCRNILIVLLKDSLFIVLGILSAGFGLKGFLLPNAFIDGGVTGISLLVAEVTGFALPFLLVIINLPFIVLESVLKLV